jgi:hypothetical protein
MAILASRKRVGKESGQILGSNTFTVILDSDRSGVRRAKFDELHVCGHGDGTQFTTATLWFPMCCRFGAILVDNRTSAHYLYWLSRASPG